MEDDTDGSPSSSEEEPNLAARVVKETNGKGDGDVVGLSGGSGEVFEGGQSAADCNGGSEELIPTWGHPFGAGKAGRG